MTSGQIPPEPGQAVTDVRADAIVIGDDLIDDDGVVWEVTAVAIMGRQGGRQAREFRTRLRGGMRVAAFVHGDWELVHRVDAGQEQG